MKKILSILLLLAMLVGSLAACGGKGNKGQETTADDGSGNATPETPAGDGWVDVWDQDPVYTPISNDTALDGVQSNGSWFESFKSRNNLFWSSNRVGTASYSNGLVTLSTSAWSEENAQSFVFSRNIMPSDNFEAEIRMKMDFFGNDNPIYIGMNGKRAIIYLFEAKLRFGIDREADGTHPRAQYAYTNIGYDWHTYKFHGHDGIVDVYVDGVYMLSGKPEPHSVSNVFAVSMYPVTQFDATTCQVDYVSYTVLGSDDVKITSPAKGATVGKGTQDVTVTAEIASKLAEANETVSFYLNDAYAGSVKINAPTVTFKGLTPGAYTVYAKCGDTVSAERVFYIEQEALATEPKNPIYSTDVLLQSSYILKFSLNGNGTLTAGDGFYALDLAFSNGKLTCDTLTGAQTLDAGNGDYIAVVDGGVLWLYRNGRQLISCRMPYRACDARVASDGGIGNLRTEAYNATLYREGFNGAANATLDPGYVPFSYAVEFEYTKGKDASVSFVDTAYFMSLAFSADGSVKGLIAPKMIAHEELLTQAKEGAHLYRVCVVNGIGQLFIDNVWVASWKLPKTVSPRTLSVKGEGIGMLRITEVDDRFYFSSERSAADWDDYFAVDKKNASDVVNIVTPWTGDTRMLKVFSKNTTVSATLNLTSGTTGNFYLVARYFDGCETQTGSGVIAGYDFASKSFKCGTAFSSVNLLKAVDLSAKSSVTLTLTVMDQTATLYCDGEKIGSWSTTLNGWGNAGYSDNLKNGSFVSFSFEGDGNPLCDTATTLIKNRHTVGIYELNNKVVIAAEGGYIYESFDGGNNFTLANRNTKLDYNTIVLNNGNLLSLKRIIEGDGLKYYGAYISSDGGATFLGPFAVHSDKNYERFTMNGKVMQASNGRIFFVSGETVNENIGELRVYYSDNEGRLWKKSESLFNQKTTGENLQEGVVVELPGGVLRMYARNDSGFVVYSDSHDNGKTWDMDMKVSNFPSVVSAFNARNDFETGAIYLAWEYNCSNDATTIQFPRTRVGMAVSYDGAQTWEYVGDFDELNDVNNRSWAHMNIGMWVTSESVFATVAKKIDNTWYNYTVQISKEGIRTSARFNTLHTMLADPTVDMEGAKLLTNGVLAISPTSGRVYASGDYYDIKAVNGKRTMLTAEMLASFLSGTLEKDGNVATVKLGAVEYVFTAGSKTALINGEQKEMTFEAIAENGTVLISIEDLDNLLGLTTRRAANGAIVITTDSAPIRLEYILAQVGIW